MQPLGTRCRSERGAVVVMVAIWLPVLALFVSFAVDFAHFFDYSRNLQNRADAAALAAGAAYGGTCFGTYAAAQTDVVGQAAQQYSGPPNGTPNANLPYPFSSTAVLPYQNQPNLTKGTPENYHVLLNSQQNWDAGGTDWNMGSDTAHQLDSTALCSSTDEDGNTGAITDVRVTQSNLGLFFPLLGFTPTISAHARVSLNAVGSENALIPLAVRDPAEERCVEANFFNATSNTQIGAPVPLTRKGTDPNTGAIQWDNASAPASVAIPTAANVYVQIVTGFCDANPSTYDASSGLLYIDSASTASPAQGAKPVVTQDATQTPAQNGVTLTGSCGAIDKLSNQYFTDQNCTIGLIAAVAFGPNAGTKNVYATDTKTGNTIQLQPVSGNTWATPIGNGFTIAAGSGQHLFSIQTAQTQNNPCTGRCDLGVQAQAFGTCDSGNPNLTCNPPNDSGPIVLGQLRLASDSSGTWASEPTQSYGENAFVGGNPQQMIVTVEMAGLSNAKPSDPPTVLRFSENSTNTMHATGSINCGQGNGASGNISSLINGCPVAGTSACPSSEFTSCAPLAINERPLNSVAPCSPEGNDLSGTVVARTLATPTVPVDCTGTVAGNMPPVVNGLACRVITAGCKPQNGNPFGTQCASNNWSKTDGASSIPAGDPRAITVVITAPSDLAKNNSGQIIPIENFAVFYITGWTINQGNGGGGGNSNPTCGSYAAAPPGVAMDAEHVNNCPDGTLDDGSGCNNVPAGEIWGFWMKYTDPNATPTPTLCNTQSFGNCTPALTR